MISLSKGNLILEYFEGEAVEEGEEEKPGILKIYQESKKDESPYEIEIKYHSGLYGRLQKIFYTSSEEELTQKLEELVDPTD